MAFYYDSPAMLMDFRRMYRVLAQQQESMLKKAGVIEYAEGDAAYFNYASISKLATPTEVTQRNQASSPVALTTTNRIMNTRKFVQEIVIDSVADIKTTIANPDSALYKQFMYGHNKLIDQIGFAAALGSVNTGTPNAAPTVVTAANDGVKFIDATGGITDTVVQKIFQNFINNEVNEERYQGASMFITGSENSELMGLDNQINKLYTTYDESSKTVVHKLRGAINVYHLAGSDATTTVSNPAIAESSGTRVCPVICRGGLYGKVIIDKVHYYNNDNRYVDSDVFKITYRIGMMRTEGVLVQGITTTIESIES